MKRVRRFKLQIENSIFWIIFSLLLILVAVFPDPMFWLAELLGIQSPANISGVQYATGVDIKTNLEDLSSSLHFRYYEAAEGKWSSPSVWGTRAIRKWESAYDGLNMSFVTNGLQEGCALIVGLATARSTEGSAQGFPTLANQFNGKMLILKFFRGNGTVQVNGQNSSGQQVYFNYGVSPNIVPANALQSAVKYNNIQPNATELVYAENIQMEVSCYIENDEFVVNVLYGEQELECTISESVLREIYGTDVPTDISAMEGKVLFANYSYQNGDRTKELTIENLIVKDTYQNAYEEKYASSFEYYLQYMKAVKEIEGCSYEELQGLAATRDAFELESGLRNEDVYAMQQGLIESDAILGEKLHAFITQEFETLETEIQAFSDAENITPEQYVALKSRLDGVLINDFFTEDLRKELLNTKETLRERLDKKVIAAEGIEIPEGSEAVTSGTDNNPQGPEDNGQDLLLGMLLGIGIPGAVIAGVAIGIVFVFLKKRRKEKNA